MTHQSADLRRQLAYIARRRQGLAVLNVSTHLARFERALRAEGRLQVIDTPYRDDLAACVAELIDLYTQHWIGPTDARTITD